MGIHTIQSELAANQAFTSAWRAMETPEGYHLGGGTTPGNGLEGWAPGAMFVESDVAGAPQYNSGSKTSATWTEIGSSALGAKFHLNDDETFEAGTLGEVIQSYDGSVFKVLPSIDDTGAFNFGNGNTDIDVKVFLGSASNHAVFDVGDSRLQLTNVQMGMGIQGTGIPTLTATPFAFELHAETGTVALTAGTTGLTCGLRCRYEVSVDQTNTISFEAIDARLRPKADLADGNHCGINGTIEASESGTVLSGTSTTVRSGGFFSLDFDANVSITSGWLCGVTIDSSVHDSVSMASCTFVGMYIKTSSSKELWETGIYIDTGSCVDGIYLGATTKACEMVVSALPANARGARFAFTCATPAMSDGYGAHEIDLTVGGAATGQTCASSCWVNAGSAATLTSGDYAFIHNDGIWLDNNATTSGSTIAYARVQFIFGTNTGYTNLHLFDLNLDIDQNMTSLFNVNNLALTGFTAGAHSSSVTGSIPFIGTGGSVKYIRVYDTAA